MTTFAFSGQPPAQVGYVACQHTSGRTHLTGFDTLAEARQYVANQLQASATFRHATLAIVQTTDDRVVYFQQPASHGFLNRWLNFFL